MAAKESGASQPRLAGAWYSVALLTALYAMSFLDRFILSLLAAPVSKDLNLSDVQMSLLLGAGFAVVYALSGVPIAQLLDLKERRTIVCSGVATWSLSTIAAGFANSFAMLAVCRAGVALGEAVLAPAAISLIADLFPREKRALPISVFASMTGLMSTGAFIIGAAALNLATAIAPVTGLAPWRCTLLLVGAPGLLLAFVFLTTIKEPARVGSVGEKDEVADLQSFVRYLARGWRFYVPFYLGASILVMFSYALLAWVPTLMIRAHGVSAANTGYLFGAVGVPAGAAGIFFFPWLATRLERAGRADGIVLGFLLAALVATPFLIFAPLSPGLPLMLSGMAAVMFSLSTTGTMSPMAMQSYGPSRMRARLLAVSLLCSSLIGFALGPTIVAFLARQWPNDPMALGRGLSVLGAFVGPAASICFALSRTGLARVLTERGA